MNTASYKIANLNNKTEKPTNKLNSQKGVVFSPKQWAGEGQGIIRPPSRPENTSRLTGFLLRASTTVRRRTPFLL